jgi:metallo-beta-lactamase family protein
MATGGRVLHHLTSLLPDPRNTVLFVGFQAAGTRGEAMLSGVDQVKIHGEYVPVRAAIEHLDALSAHADYVELIDWLRPMGPAPRQTFLVHGEPSAQDAFRRHLRDFLGWPAIIPRHGDVVELP